MKGKHITETEKQIMSSERKSIDLCVLLKCSEKDGSDRLKMTKS